MKLVLMGLALVLAGVVLPFLMVIKVVETSFILSMGSFAVSLAGLVMGIVAASRLSRPKHE